MERKSDPNTSFQSTWLLTGYNWKQSSLSKCDFVCNIHTPTYFSTKILLSASCTALFNKLLQSSVTTCSKTVITWNTVESVPQTMFQIHLFIWLGLLWEYHPFTDAGFQPESQKSLDSCCYAKRNVVFLPSTLWFTNRTCIPWGLRLLFLSCVIARAKPQDVTVRWDGTINSPNWQDGGFRHRAKGEFERVVTTAWQLTETQRVQLPADETSTGDVVVASLLTPWASRMLTFR